MLRRLTRWPVIRPSSSSKPSAPRSAAAAAACPPSIPPTCSATSRAPSIERTGIDPAEIGQVVGGCVSQVGEQSFNIARTAWLAAGLPLDDAGHHGRHPVRLVASRPPTWPPSLVGAGVVDVAVACGVESMSRIPIGVNSSKKLGLGVPIPKAYFGRYEFTSQFEGAERIADKWGITREDCDAFGLASQQRAARAWAEDRFDTQVVPVDAADLDEEGKPTGSTHTVAARRGPPRDHRSRSWPRSSRSPARTACTPPARRRRSPTAPPPCCMTTEAKADELGLTPRARVVDTCLVGVDPVLMLTGPIDATQRLLERTGLTIDRHRPVRDQRGVRLGRAGLGQGGRRRPRARPTPTAAPSPSATRSAAPVPSS